MGNYDININVNMGDGSGGNFQSLIDSVNKLQTSMEKVGTAADTARSKSRDTVKSAAAQLRDYNKEIDNAKIKLVQYDNDLKKHNADLKAGIITQEEYNQKVRDTKKNIADTRQTLEQSRVAYNRLNAEMKQAGVIVKKTNASFVTLKSTLNSLASVMGFSLSIFGGFMAIKNIIKTISEFELSQKKLRAVLGETVDGMKELSKSAIDVGRASIFGAKGVSELQVELAKMGFTKNEIMAMQSAIVDLATATQEDLATSAEVVANVIRAFNLTAAETRDVVNVMGFAFNKSGLDLTNFREAIKYVAPVANQAGLSLRETASAMMVLANAGIKGSLTGTALNNVLKAMMDENSKLSKEMGGAVKGWEGFVSVLQKAREEGFDIGDLFGLIAQRGTAAFAVLKNGLPTINEMNDALQDVSNVIADQALVQLHSLTHQTKLLKEAWKGFVLELDRGDGWLSKIAKTIVVSARAIVNSWVFDKEKMVAEVADLSKRMYEAINFEGISEEAKKNLEIYIDALSRIKEVAKLNKVHAAALWFDFINPQFVKPAEEEITSIIVSEAKKRIEAMNLSKESYEKWDEEVQTNIIMQTALRKRLADEGKAMTLEWKIANETIQQLNKLTFTKDNEKPKEDPKKLIRERYQLELEMLKLQQKLSEERIKLHNDEAFHEHLILENTFKFKRKIAEKELEMAIALGGDKKKLQKNFDLEMQVMQLEYINKMISLQKKADDAILKMRESNLKEMSKLVKKRSDNDVKYYIENLKKLQKFFETWSKDHPLLDKLFGEELYHNFLKGLINEDDIKRFTDSFDKAFESIGSNINSYADSWVEATDRVVQQLNRQVDETQAALNTETQLMAQGYANNVSLKKKELEDLKQARKRALQEQREAQQAQVAIDTVMQMSSLTTASAQIFQAFSKIPVIGVPLAIAMIGTMFGSFAAAKVKAMQVAGLNKFEEGGWVGGKRHRDGGTVLEAEKDEFIVRRNSALKYRTLIEAVNKDDMPEINRWYLNRMRSQVMSATVSLDKSKELVAIRKLLEGNSHRNVQYFNGYRIESDGITRTKIVMN